MIWQNTAAFQGCSANRMPKRGKLSGKCGFKQVEQRAEQGLTEEFEEVGSDQVLRRYRLARNVPLNESNRDVRVDFLDVREPTGRDSWRRFTFILDPLLGLCREHAERWMWGGRSRWKIENETFNTLKNQGYQFEHNYGHGHQNVAVNFQLLFRISRDSASREVCLTSKNPYPTHAM